MGSLDRRLRKLEDRLAGRQDIPVLEELLRRALELLPNKDLFLLSEALERLPDDGGDRLPVELFTPEEAASLGKLEKLLELQQQP